MPTCGVGLSVRGRGGERGCVYRFGEQVSGPRAACGTGPDSLPLALLYIFLSFSYFLFLFSISFVDFAF
jgi:hypothetical protein